MSKGTCSVDGCNKPRRKFEWCDGHYQRWKKHGDVLADRPLRASRPTTGRCVVAGCIRDQVAKERCLMHYKRWRNHGSDSVPTLADRLWANTTKGPYCWEWNGSRRGMGYGRISVNGKSRLTHRVSWELTNGPIPEGLDVLHHCDNPPCIRPDHLFLGTDADNAADKMAKGRGNNTHSGRGQKLTWDLVASMRRDSAAGLDRRTTACTYGVSPSMVSLIVRGKSWDPRKRKYE